MYDFFCSYGYLRFFFCSYGLFSNYGLPYGFYGLLPKLYYLDLRNVAYHLSARRPSHLCPIPSRLGSFSPDLHSPGAVSFQHP